MTREENIQYYESLSEREKLVLKLAALEANGFDERSIQRASHYHKQLLSHREILSLFKLLLQKEIINNQQTWYGQYNIDDRFLIHVFPLLKEHKKEIKRQISEIDTFYHSRLSRQILLRDMLYALIFDNEETYREKECELIKHTSRGTAVQLIAEIADDSNYLPYLDKISPSLFGELVNYQAGINQFYLVPFSETKRAIERYSSYAELSRFSSLLAMSEYYFGGRIDKAVAVATPTEGILPLYFLPALKLLVEDHVEESLKVFEKGLKSQRKVMKGYYLPYGLTMAFLYITALMRTDLKLSMPTFQRILKSFKHDYPAGYNLFNILIKYLLGEHFNREYMGRQLEEALSQNSIIGLIALPVYYLCDFKLTQQSHLKHLFALIKKADDAGFILPALEAAYALHALYQTNETEALYNRIAAKVDYAPFTSKVVRVEEWEKSLNLLMSLQTPTAKNTSKDSEASTRIIYFFNPKYKTIQPALQSRGAKGWSKGRNIAMKTFFEGKVDSMTEQDLRISKSIK